MQPDLTIAEVTRDSAQMTPPPRVYYLPDGQGRMAAYYNAVELPEEYTTTHGIPRTNHFVPVGYCCMDEVAPRPRGYRGSNRRNGYGYGGNASTTVVQESEKVGSENRAVVAEPRAPPSSPDQQLISIVEVPTQLKREIGQAQAPEDRDTTCLPSQAPTLTGSAATSCQQAQHSPQTQIQQPCTSTTCSARHAQPAVRSLPRQTSMATSTPHTPPYPPAICRRWLIGTCRRGPACRNRHHVLHETDAQLCAIKEAHLATMRFYHRSVGAPAPVGKAVAIPERGERERRGELPAKVATSGTSGISWADEVEGQSRQTAFVDAHIEGVGKVKIPIEVLAGQLQGFSLDDEGKKKSPIQTSPQQTDNEEEEHEPLPDYSVAMPPTPSPAAKPTTQSPPPPPNQPIRHRALRPLNPSIHPAERFRALYGGDLRHLPFYPRRHVSQDFVPRHVVDRALRQYIAGSLRGRRLLEKREVKGWSARKKAILEGIKMGAGEVESKDTTASKVVEEGKNEVNVTAATIEKDGVGFEERENCGDGEVEKKVEVLADKAMAVPASSVELAHV